ncbi:MAG: hypothetical protein KF784_06390 [Fimbriimonadaceae bacterium]|nr:hypothetical protein [Fimbriimonadaceae bacterium]
MNLPTLYLHRANDEASIRKAADKGWGIEVDIRSYEHDIYLAHDPILSAPSFTGLDLLKGFPGPVIFDFKESGIVDLTIKLIKWAGLDLNKCYAADMIVPDMIRAERNELKTLARLSPYEVISGPFYGYWLDYVKDTEPFTHVPKHTFLVSPELHGWTLDKDFKAAALRAGFEGICTDFPERWNDCYSNEQWTQISA